MYLRFIGVLLLSCLATAQPRPDAASYSPANQGSINPDSTNQGSAAPSQDSPPPSPEQKKEQSQEKSGTGAEDVGGPGQSKAAADPSKVAPDAAVITVEGFCDHTALTTVVKGPSSGCKSIVTREQFDQLVDALDPNMRPDIRHAVATGLPHALVFSKKAKELGLEKDPRYAQLMKWSSLQSLSNVLNAQLQKKAADISDAEIETYYKDNGVKFQECELQRIFIPKNKPASSDAQSNAEKQGDRSEEAATKVDPEKIQAKAAAGGDFIALQQEAFDAMGITSSPPSVNIGKRIPASLPPSQQKVFDLQPGQVSELFSDAAGFYVYKVVSKNQIPFSEAKVQIRKTLASQREQASAESLFGSVKFKFNQNYFGQPAPAAKGDALFPDSAPATAGRPGQPSAASAGQTSQINSLDKEWAESSVRSYLLKKDSDAFVPPPVTVVPSNVPVIIVEGVCDHKPPSAKACQTTVTRADFRAMMHAVDPKASADVVKRWADQYADTLVHGIKARQLGLENTREYKLAMAYQAMENLFKMLNNRILEQARQLSDADLKEFYGENLRLFEEIKVVRIVIPQFKAFPPGKPTPTSEQIAAGHAEMKKEAENIAVRAALPGADLQALENEGWKFSDYVEDPPDIGQPPLLRWEIWPRTRLSIFDLKVGEVSPLIDEPENGFYVFKILAKREVPFVEARGYIRKRYAGERYLDAAGRMLSSVKTSLNDEYFAKEKQRSVPGAPGEQPDMKNTKLPSLNIKIPKKVNL